jgi:hypothetical protein
MKGKSLCKTCSIDSREYNANKNQIKTLEKGWARSPANL